MRKPWLFFCLSILFAFPVIAQEANEVSSMCQKISQKLHSVNYNDCLSLNYSAYSKHSTAGWPLLLKEYKGAENKNVPKILFIGGIHGDEYSSVSSTFKWLKVLEQHHTGKFHWLFMPLANPDGLLRKTPQRMNAMDVDLNRNFPPFGENSAASIMYWKNKAGKDPRRFPGIEPLSEPETQAIVEIIDDFQPNVIVSVHAPYDLLDFDGENAYVAPKKMGPLELQQLGTYPGSLGNYAWLKLNIPVITLELPKADIMPNDNELDAIWMDLIGWLKNDLPKTRLASSAKPIKEATLMKN